MKEATSRCGCSMIFRKSKNRKCFAIVNRLVCNRSENTHYGFLEICQGHIERDKSPLSINKNKSQKIVKFTII